MHVCRVQWVRAAFRFPFHLGDIGVVNGVESARCSWLVPLNSTGASNVINCHHISSFTSSHGVSLGLALVDIVDVHGVANELGRGDRAYLNFRKLVAGVQRVVALTRGLELVNVGLGTLDVGRPEVGLLLVEADVEGTGARSVNVPIAVRKLLFLRLLGAVQFGSST